MLNSLHLEGVERFNTDDYQAAKALFIEAIQKNPEEPESYWFLAKSYFFCDEQSEAITHLDKYIELNKNEIANVAYAYDLRGQCYEAGDNNEAALDDYTKATNIYPRAASAWHNLALFYIKLAQKNVARDLRKSFEQFKEAENALSEVFQICSSNPMFLHSAASWHRAYVRALKAVKEEIETIDNHFKLAIEYYQTALTVCRKDDRGLQNIITDNFTECLMEYAEHPYTSEDYSKALELYTQVLEFKPDHLNAIYQIGMSLYKQNRFSEARESFSDILGKTSDEQELADAWLNIACTYLGEKSWDNAEHALNEAKKLAPKDPYIDNVAQELRDSKEQELRDSKAQASLIAGSQSMFSHPNTDSQPTLSPEVEEKSFQLN